MGWVPKGTQGGVQSCASETTGVEGLVVVVVVNNFFLLCVVNMGNPDVLEKSVCECG